MPNFLSSSSFVFPPVLTLKLRKNLRTPKALKQIGNKNSRHKSHYVSWLTKCEEIGFLYHQRTLEFCFVVLQCNCTGLIIEKHFFFKNQNIL